MGRRVGRTGGLAALLVLTLVVAGCTGGGKGKNAKSTPELPIGSSASVPGAPGPYSTTGRGPQPPGDGVWLGAWVKPDALTPTGRLTAFDDFEDQAGRQLPIAHIFHDWTDEFPTQNDEIFVQQQKLLLISWSGTDTRSITSGVYDSLIRSRARGVKDLGVPVLLRFRWEMDRPNLAASVHSPQDYVAAWKHVRKIFTDEHATNAGWVWCPHVRGFVEPGRNAAAYYPGDDQVDYLCADVYAGRDFDGFAAQLNEFMPFAQKHPRPIIIGELGVTDRGDISKRVAWLREVRTYTKAHPQIKGLVYFAAKQSGTPVYDTTFADDPHSQAAFRELAADPYFAARAPQ